MLTNPSAPIVVQAACFLHRQLALPLTAPQQSVLPSDWSITQIPPGGLQAPHQDPKAPAFLVTFSPPSPPPAQSFLVPFQHAPEPSPWDLLLSLIKTIFPQESLPVTEKFHHQY